MLRVRKSYSFCAFCDLEFDSSIFKVYVCVSFSGDLTCGVVICSDNILISLKTLGCFKATLQKTQLKREFSSNNGG